MSDKIIYQLVISDLQFVATETINRKLTPNEIETIATKIADRIDWYDTISMVIRENFE
ncbi:MAG: hypothetical protein WCH34_18125 [Bacteroidota bacterium]